MRAHILALSLALAASALPAAAQTADPLPPPQRAVGAPGALAILRGLDKVTGQYRDFQAPVGKAVKFHTLQVTARACQKAPAEEAPETAVFMEVTDTPLQKKGQPAPETTKIFSGWIFASSPALNALEHPVYDVWAIDCR